jgi:hydrogenase nickel incorporation protein HypA/HybF
VHEMSIAQSLIDIVREEMIKNNANIIRTVRLSVGEMSAVVPESLEFCFSILTSKTPLEGVRLIMDIVPLKGYCRECEGIFKIENFIFVCPSCGSGQVEAIEGKDLSIVEMEVE